MSINLSMYLTDIIGVKAIKIPKIGTVKTMSRRINMPNIMNAADWNAKNKADNSKHVRCQNHFHFSIKETTFILILKCLCHLTHHTAQSSPP